MHKKNYTSVKCIIGSVLLTGLLTSLPLIADPRQGTRKVDNHSDPSSQSRPQSGVTAKPTAHPVFSEFNSWATEYIAGRATKSAEKRGEELAKLRREALGKVIQADPKQAISFAISASSKSKLPSNVTPHLEEEVSGYGDLFLTITDSIDPATRKMTVSQEERVVKLGGKTYRAFVYGRRATMLSKVNTPLNGIVVDGMMAVNESPVRILQTESTSGKVELDVDVGGIIRRFRDREQLQRFTDELIQREAVYGPGSKARARNRRGARRAAANPASNSSWTVGGKTVLFMRVEFPDMLGEPTERWGGEPLTITRAQSLIEEDVRRFFMYNSYGRTSLRATVTPLLTMPQPSSYYTAANTPDQLGRILDDARAAALAGGFDTANYDLDIVAFSSLPLGFTAASRVGAKGVCLNGAFDLSTTAHELGHSFGLRHANLWRTTDNSVIGPGESVEYGDPFDMMGGSSDDSNGFAGHFNGWFKHRLNWLGDASVKTVVNSGTYRLLAINNPRSVGTRALKIPSAHGTYYWVEFREFSPNPIGLSGAQIRWGYDVGVQTDGSRESNLLVMNPGGAFGAQNAPLAIGQTFNDPASGISIKPLRRLQTIPRALEVEVTLSKYILNGRVVDQLGFGIDGVSINLAGADSVTLQTGTNGVYSVAVQLGGSYSLTPLNPDHWFRPARRILPRIASSATTNFSALLAVSTTVSGRVTDLGGEGIAGVTMSVTGSLSANTTSASTSTGSDGTYVMRLFGEGTYTLRPFHIFYNFDPGDCRAVGNNTCNFTGSRIRLFISGKVTDPNNQAISGATVRLRRSGSNSSTVITTDSVGEYSFTVLAGDSYTVTPSMNNYTFAPTSQTFELISSSQTSVNFTGEPGPTNVRFLLNVP